MPMWRRHWCVSLSKNNCYMITVYLIRHGEVQGNKEGPEQIYVGRTDIPLTERGHQQAAALEMALQEVHLDAIYCSSLQRTRQTAEAVAEAHGLEIVADAAWDELNYGDWEALTVAQMESGWGDLWQQRQANPVQVRPPQGENYADMWQRLQPAWLRLLEQHSDQAVAVFAHKGTIRILLAALLGMPLENFKRIHSSNTGVSCVQLQHTTANPVVRYMNDTAHLALHLI